ncbi:MAG: cysteine hydrolase [Clostridia bacterium]|nr:cysteine hydrolase [Clostridia bacterium]
MKNIIIVDMQKGFINENNIHIVQKINEYLNENKFDNIIFTKCTNSPDSPFRSILNWDGLNNVDEQEIIVNIPNNSHIITKDCYGISIDDIRFLKSLNINEIEICGTDTDACCLSIAFNLFDNNIKPIILQNLCASSSSNKNIHKNSLEIMKRQFGKENIR